MSIPCRGGEYATLTLLHATAGKVPIGAAVDLVSLVPWARHPDVCLRHIAIDAILRAIAFDRNQLSVPGMHEPEHHHYHHIFVALRAHLIGKGVRFDPAIFEGLMLEVTAADFARLVHGSWAEEAEGKGFLESVVVDAKSVRATSHHVPPDPAWPDTTWTTEIAEVKADERGQLVVSGRSSVESSSRGVNPKIEPSPYVFTFWPVAPDVMWMRDTPTAYWIKLRRKPG
jgi:hypothetical protein